MSLNGLQLESRSLNSLLRNGPTGYSSSIVADASAPESSFVPVCPLADIPVGQSRGFTISSREIAVFRPSEQTLHAFANRCPHRGALLTEGAISGDRIVCAWHSYSFDLNSGKCDMGGCDRLKVFEVRVEEEWVKVRVK